MDKVIIQMTQSDIASCKQILGDAFFVSFVIVFLLMAILGALLFFAFRGR